MQITFLLLGTKLGKPDWERFSVSSEGSGYTLDHRDDAWRYFQANCPVPDLTYGLRGDGTIVIKTPLDQLDGARLQSIQEHARRALRQI